MDIENYTRFDYKNTNLSQPNDYYMIHQETVKSYNYNNEYESFFNNNNNTHSQSYIVQENFTKPLKQNKQITDIVEEEFSKEYKNSNNKSIKPLDQNVKLKADFLINEFLSDIKNVKVKK